MIETIRTWIFWQVLVRPATLRKLRALDGVRMTFRIGSKKRWWNNPQGGSYVRLYGAIALMVVAALYEIFSSPLARWWFGGLIVASVVVALVIRLQRGDGL
jgi:hypothetical protein